MPNFTRVEQRMVDLLSDGLPHTRDELHACLYHTSAPLTSIHPHITSIRQKLRRIGHDIVCERGPFKVRYRHVRLLNSEE